MTSPFNFSMDLPVRGEWSNVERLRASVQSCLASMFDDSDRAAALAMVTGELLENAVKYGHWSGNEATRVFRLRVRGDDQHAEVSVENPIQAGDAGLAELLGTLDRLGAAQSPAEAYHARLLEVAAERGTSSRLGLLRIAYEGGCTLRAEVSDDVLRVTATLSY